MAMTNIFGKRFMRLLFVIIGIVFAIYAFTTRGPSNLAVVELGDCSVADFQAFSVRRSLNCGSPATRPADIHHTRKVWQHVQEGNNEMVLYTAHFDPRLEFPGFAGTVRVVGIGAHDIGADVYCHIWYPGLENPVIMKALPTRSTGSGLGLQGKGWMEHLYTCPLSSVAYIPSQVSLSFERCSELHNLITVIVPAKFESALVRNQSLHSCDARFVPADNYDTIKYEHDFGVCVCVSYGEINASRLVEWFELNQILGVTEFNVFDSNITGDSLPLLNYYKSKGILKVRPLPPPVEPKQMWPFNLNTIAGLNRCVYENMYRYKYLVIIDFDEFIMSDTYKKHEDLARRLEADYPNNVGAFMFYNTYFWLNYPPGSMDKTRLTTTRYVRHTDISPQGYSLKSFTNPRRCAAHTNHYCMITVMKDTQLHYVDPKIAKLHHYKKCHFNKEECDKSLSVSYQDLTAWNYYADLSERVNSTLKQAGLWDKLKNPK